MKKAERDNWIINIENAYEAACLQAGQAVADSVLQRYDAHGLYDISSCYYGEVFGDLELIVNGN